MECDFCFYFSDERGVFELESGLAVEIDDRIMEWGSEKLKQVQALGEIGRIDMYVQHESAVILT